MEQPSTTDRRYTVEEYLAIDEACDVRHEFRDGEMLAMSGAVFPHVQITSTSDGHVGNPAGRHAVSDAHARHAGPCRRAAVGTATRTSASSAASRGSTRPIARSPSSTRRWSSRCSRRSTESSDRGEKFTRYRQMESLQEYLLVAQDRPRVEPFSPSGRRRLGHRAGRRRAGRRAAVRSLGVELPLSEIYDRVTFSPAAAGAGTAGLSSDARPPPVHQRRRRRGRPGGPPAAHGAAAAGRRLVHARPQADQRRPAPATRWRSPTTSVTRFRRRRRASASGGTSPRTRPRCRPGSSGSATTGPRPATTWPATSSPAGRGT